MFYRPSRTTAIITALIAASFGSFGVLSALDLHRFERDCVRTQGRVRAHETARTQNKYGRWVEHAVDVYAFTTQSGETAYYEFWRFGSGHAPIGETHTICYPEGAPEKARLASETLLPTVAMFGIAATFALVAWASWRGFGREPALISFSHKNRAKRERKRRRRA